MSSSNELAQDRTDWAEDRTIQANERTFAGWMRTGMGALGVAIALRAVFGEFDPTWAAKAVASIFILLAIDPPKLLLAIAYIYATSGPVMTLVQRRERQQDRQGRKAAAADPARDPEPEHEPDPDPQPGEGEGADGADGD